HRLELRYANGSDAATQSAALVFGFDQLFNGYLDGSPGGDTLTTYGVSPRLKVERPISDTLRLRTGVEGSVRRFRGLSRYAEERIELEF
ncbi:hypothetical protein ACXWPL_09475, partial [Streptococcus pyogenes]